jgi:hypothetical protein
MNEESLNLGEALRLAREKANRERNRAKCRKYYRNRTEKMKGDIVGEDTRESGAG